MDYFSSLITDPHTIFKEDMLIIYIGSIFRFYVLLLPQLKWKKKKKSSPAILFSHCVLLMASTYLQVFLSDRSFFDMTDVSRISRNKELLH